MNAQISLQSYDRIFSAVHEYHVPFEMIGALTAAYESGMKEILRQLATTRRLDFNCADMPDYREANEQAKEAYSRLKDALTTDEQRKLLLRMDETYNREAMVESDEAFIAGFIQGYQFLIESTRSGIK